ncbi:MAG: hypothetical protein RHS_4693 [Robinsoniella sp. RHS]|nr:MAG: hypothetical protein RHS_4693 [Robinsoniella sp. RHS]
MSGVCRVTGDRQFYDVYIQPESWRPGTPERKNQCNSCYPELMIHKQHM